MIKELLKIYEENTGKQTDPPCTFKENLIFNEGWLLRGVIKSLKEKNEIKNYKFLPIPQDAKLYSEGSLKTPFLYGETLEGYTNFDAIAGDFEIEERTKSAIRIPKNFKYLTIFEAKMFSVVQKGVKYYKEHYSQVTRTVVCIANLISSHTNLEDKKVNFVLICPKKNIKNNKEYCDKIYIRNQIEERIEKYGKNKVNKPFLNNWENILNHMDIELISWEDIIDYHLKDETLKEFYKKCIQFNKR